MSRKMIVDLQDKDGEIFTCESIERLDDQSRVFSDWYCDGESITDKISWYELSNAEVGKSVSGYKVVRVEIEA